MRFICGGLCRTVLLIGLGLVVPALLLAAEAPVAQPALPSDADVTAFSDEVEAEIIDAMFSLASGYFPGEVKEQEAAPLDAKTFGKQAGEDTLILQRATGSGGAP